MNCNKCGKTISLFDINASNFMEENNHLEIRCNSCNDKKNYMYYIGMISIIIAAFLLISFFIFNYLIIGFFTIIVTIFSIVSQFYFVEKRTV